LTVRQNGEQPTTLYFLFGHLFHAVGNGMAGDDAVVGALNFSSGEFDFDAKAKLPADESVKSSIAELVKRAGAERSGRGPWTTPPRPAPAPQPPVSNPPPPPAILRAAGESAPPPMPAPQPAPQAKAPPALPTPPPTPMPPPLDGGMMGPPPMPPPAPQPPPPVQQPPPAHQPPPAPPPAMSHAPAPPPPASPAAPRQQPPARAGVPVPRAQPAPASPQQAPVAPSTAGLKYRPLPPREREPIPVPAGQVMYDSLKTSFVDFPRLLTTLQREGYTGYVRLLTDSASGLIYFRQGTVLECVFDSGRDPLETGRGALQRFDQEVMRGQGVLDVVGLSAELIDGLYELTVAQPIYTELYAAWVDLNAFLAFLEDRKLTGSLMVRSDAATGVIIFDQGRLRGAYTSEDREVTSRADMVLSLCRDPNAMIEVKAAPEASPQPLAVDDMLGSPRNAAAPPAWWQAASRSTPGAPSPQLAPAAPPPVGTPVEAHAMPASPASPMPAGPQLAPAAAAPPPPVPAAPSPAQRPSSANGPDWEAIVAELQQMTEESLGNRSRKVKDALAAAERSRQGLEAAIDQVPTISILFVDASRLEALANDLRARLYSYLG
jgi:hypothetical protein